MRLSTLVNQEGVGVWERSLSVNKRRLTESARRDSERPDFSDVVVTDYRESEDVSIVYIIKGTIEPFRSILDKMESPWRIETDTPTQ